MSLINNLSHVIKEGCLDIKRELIGVMFPEKFDFDGKSYRTNTYNKVLDLIYLQTNELRGQKEKRLFRFPWKVSFGTPSGARLRYLQMRSRVLESLHPPNLPEREA